MEEVGSDSALVLVDRNLREESSCSEVVCGRLS